jgi:4'-phosphopantetheinyl transferase
MSSLFSAISNVPESLPEGGIILISGGLDVFKRCALSREESDRAHEISSSDARARFVAARRIVRSALSQWMAVNPVELEILSDEHGKPFLLANDPMHFSITHSSDRVAVAFSRNRVGLDLEHVREVDAPALASRFFSTEEAAWFDGATNTDLFFKLWTSREAAIKADGRGLSKLLGITRVTAVGDGDVNSVQVQIGPNQWDVIHWKMGEGIHQSLAFQEKPTLISWCDLS